MKETKFTKGPWEVKNTHIYCDVGPVTAGHHSMIDVQLNRYIGEDKDNEVANANLIAAAPELYEALVTASAIYQIIIDMGRTEYKELLDQANSVLSKARGESQ